MKRGALVRDDRGCMQALASTMSTEHADVGLRSQWENQSLGEASFKVISLDTAFSLSSDAMALSRVKV